MQQQAALAASQSNLAAYFPVAIAPQTMVHFVNLEIQF